MSSYLNFFIKTKEKDGIESRFIRIASFSGSHPLHQLFWEGGVCSTLKYNSETHEIENTENYSRIDDSIIDEILEDLNRLISRTKRQLDVYYKLGYKKDLEEYAMEICREEEYLEELIEQKHQVETIAMFADQTKDTWIDVEGLYGAID